MRVAALEDGVTVAELDQRALRLIGRVRDKRVLSPLVGVPMGAGMKPFVTRLDWIDVQSKGVTNIRARFDFAGDRAVLVITGEFGTVGHRGRHTAKVPDLQGIANRCGIDCNVAWTLRGWAEKHREEILKTATGREAKADRVAAEAGMDKEELATSKRRVRLEGKRKRIDTEIARLRKQIGKIYANRPVNPIIGREGSWDRESNDWERKHAMQYCAEKAMRKLISNLGAKYLQLKTVRPNKRRRSWSGSAVVISFPWAKFYAELSEYGIKPTYEYAKVHAWKDGPSCPESYLRNMNWFGLMPDRSGYSPNYSRRHLRENMPDVKVKTEAERVAERMAEHNEAKLEYMAEVNQWKMLESMIEGLEAERVGVGEEIDNLNRRGE